MIKEGRKHSLLPGSVHVSVEVFRHEADVLFTLVHHISLIHNHELTVGDYLFQMIR